MGGRLEGKVGLVTGGASGIGRGIAERWLTEGAQVLIADKNVPLMKKVTAQFGNTVADCEVDVTDEESVAQMVSTAVDRFGRLDITANCAYGLSAAAMARTAASAGTMTSPFWEQDAAAWRAGVDGGLFSVFLCLKHESKQMKAQGQGGAIINISSINARQCAEGLSSYCATKAGVEMLVRCAGMELGPYGIRVTGIAPGLIETPGAVEVFKSQSMVDSFHRNTPLGRHGQPADIAAAATFLASDDAAWITAEILTVDGGEMTRGYPRRFELLAVPRHRET